MWFSSPVRRPKATRKSSPRRGKLVPVLEPLEERTAPAVFRVTRLADSNDPASGALRAAISASNATPGPNEIDILAPGTYALTLNGTATDNSVGELTILNNDVTIVNQSGGTVVIDASAVNTRVLDIAPTGPAVNVTLTGLTIRHGSAGTGAGIRADILTQQGFTLTLNNDIVQANTATFDGGGIFIFGGALTLNGTAVRDNGAGRDGGGIAALLARVTLTNSSVTGNHAGGSGGGGTIANGSLTVTNSIVSDNSQTDAGSSARGGGGIRVFGDTVTITNSLIANNSSSATGAGHGGGGLLINGKADVTITSSEFSDNRAANDGGGLLTFGTGTLTVEACTFNGNHAGGQGGGVSLESIGDSSLDNVTLSGNSAALGGGLCQAGSALVTLTNDTIAFNQAVTAGGVFSSVANDLSLTSTIVAKNSAGVGGDPDVDNNTGATDLVDGGNNFIGDNTGAADSFAAGTPNAHGSFVGTPPLNIKFGLHVLDPLLDPLTDNGASAALPDGSHLLTHQDEADSGNNGVRDRGPTLSIGARTDERGFPGLVGSAEDIGAFEFQNFDMAASVSAPPGPVHAGLPVTFTVTIRNLGPNPSHGVMQTATLPAGTAVLGASGSFTVSGNVVTFAVPDLAPGGSTTVTLTVLPAAPGPFTVKAAASTHDDPNLANNTATLTLTVLPRPFPATGSADVTGLVQLMPVGRRRRAQRQLALLITNVSGTPIQGPLEVVVPGLRPRRGPKLLNAAGRTGGGQKFVRVNVGGDGILDPGQSAVVVLVFSQPFTPPGLDVMAGAFA
jgi:uncharacterized repeat protein (TIGR01451 family)